MTTTQQKKEQSPYLFLDFAFKFDLFFFGGDKCSFGDTNVFGKSLDLRVQHITLLRCSL
jgi:hypothetical protein